MIVLGIDPGDSLGLAVCIDGVIDEVHQVAGFGSAAGVRRVAALLRSWPPDRVVIEDPANVRLGSSTRARHELQRRVGAILALCWVAYPSVEVELVPTAVWQRWAHAGCIGDPKDRSLQRVMNSPRTREATRALWGPSGGKREDAWDAGCLALWGSR